MKNYLSFCLLIIFSSGSTFAQVGIGTPTPDPSALLDVYSQSKGLLMPRLTVAERDLIVLPANGLMIYNITSNDGQLNTGTPELPIWTGIKDNNYASHAVESVSEGGNVSTVSTENILIPGMILHPAAGSYLLLFNAQISGNYTFSSDQGVTAVNDIYSQLLNLPGAQPHGLVFGNGEVLLPGIYNVAGATSLSAILTLDGGGNPNALFVIKSAGALTTGAGTEVILINGASANNIFWVAEGAISTGAGTIMKGTLVAHTSAVSSAANTNLEGRMFSTGGAVTMGATTFLIAPQGSSPFDLGVLSNFVMFTAAGAISGCPDCGITGNVGTAIGDATSFDNINGTVYLPGETTSPISSTYTIYKEDTEVPYSSRSFSSPSANVTLQSMITIADGESIEVRWKSSSGKANIQNRILSLIRSF